MRNWGGDTSPVEALLLCAVSTIAATREEPHEPTCREHHGFTLDIPSSASIIAAWRFSISYVLRRILKLQSHCPRKKLKRKKNWYKRITLWCWMRKKISIAVIIMNPLPLKGHLSTLCRNEVQRLKRDALSNNSYRFFFAFWRHRFQAWTGLGCATCGLLYPLCLWKESCKVCLITGSTHHPGMEKQTIVFFIDFFPP